MERRSGLHDLPARHLWRRSALPHDGGLQPQAEAAPACTASKEAVQALGTDLVEGEGLVSYPAMLQSSAGKSFCGWAGKPLTLLGVLRLSRDLISFGRH